MEPNNVNDILAQELEKAGIVAEGTEPKETETAPEETPAEQPVSAETSTEEKPVEEKPTDEASVEIKSADEPKVETPEVDPEKLVEQATQEPELIDGKFKSQDELLNAYHNLQKQFTQKSQQAAEVVRSQDDVYWDNEIAKAEDIVAKDIVTKALDTITDPAQKTEAMTAMNKWLQTGSAEDLSACLGYMDVRVERQVRLQAMDASAKIRAEATRLRDEAWQKPLVEELKTVRAEDPEWFDAPETQEIIKAAIALNGAKLDVKGLKKMIQAVSDKAVEKYKAKVAKETAVNAEKQVVSVKSASHNEPPKPEKPVDPNDIEAMLGKEYTKLGLGQ